MEKFIHYFPSNSGAIQKQYKRDHVEKVIEAAPDLTPMSPNKIQYIS